MNNTPKKRTGTTIFIAGAFLFLLLAVTVVSPTVVPAESGKHLWVTSGISKLHAEPRATSPTVAELPLGTELVMVERKGRWYRVRTSKGESGWIYRGRVSDTPPAQETTPGEVGSLFAALSGNQITAEEADEARSIRGLSKDTEGYADMQATPAQYRKALEKVLAMKITEQELEDFLRQGKIGEYAP